MKDSKINPSSSQSPPYTNPTYSHNSNNHKISRKASQCYKSLKSTLLKIARFLHLIHAPRSPSMDSKPMPSNPFRPTENTPITENILKSFSVKKFDFEYTPTTQNIANCYLFAGIRLNHLAPIPETLSTSGEPSFINDLEPSSTIPECETQEPVTALPTPQEPEENEPGNNVHVTDDELSCDDLESVTEDAPQSNTTPWYDDLNIIPEKTTELRQQASSAKTSNTSPIYEDSTLDDFFLDLESEPEDETLSESADSFVNVFDSDPDNKSSPSIINEDDTISQTASSHNSEPDNGVSLLDDEAQFFGDEESISRSPSEVSYVPLFGSEPPETPPESPHRTFTPDNVLTEDPPKISIVDLQQAVTETEEKNYTDGEIKSILNKFSSEPKEIMDRLTTLFGLSLKLPASEYPFNDGESSAINDKKILKKHVFTLLNAQELNKKSKDLTDVEKNALRTLAFLVNEKSLIIAQTLPIFFRVFRGEEFDQSMVEDLNRESWSLSIKLTSEVLTHTVTDISSVKGIIDFAFSDAETASDLKSLAPKFVPLSAIGKSFSLLLNTLSSKEEKAVSKKDTDKEKKRVKKSQEKSLFSQISQKIKEIQMTPKYEVSVLDKEQKTNIRIALKGFDTLFTTLLKSASSSSDKEETDKEETDNAASETFLDAYKEIKGLFKECHPFKVLAFVISDDESRKAFQSILKTYAIKSINPLKNTKSTFVRPYIVFATGLLFEGILKHPEFEKNLKLFCEETNIDIKLLNSHFDKAAAYPKEFEKGISNSLELLRTSGSPANRRKHLSAIGATSEIFNKKLAELQRQKDMPFENLYKIRYELRKAVDNKNLLIGKVNLSKKLKKNLDKVDNNWKNIWKGLIKTLSEVSPTETTKK